ncbi:PilW family protein [Vibrio fluminensis]|uniref:PilW family protein n=1 Tax=Vibrio fluminensis TaxID=2783614 RepID=UPI0018875A55|nr:type II secretion system protein [Vibrio fluminensis]
MKIKGFTLIEMVVSITILGIVSIGLMNFGLLSSSIFVENKYRLEALEEARFALARFARELANTVPLSPRVLDSGSCLEYLPLLYVGEFVPEQVVLNSNATETEFPLAHPLGNELSVCLNDPNKPCLVSIYPRAATDLYSGANQERQIYTLKSYSNNSITVKEGLTRLPLTPSNRLFIYQPFARQMCVKNGQLSYFPSYDLSFAGLGVANSRPSVPMAKGLMQAQDVFSLGFNGTYSSTVNLRFSLVVNNGKESVEFMQNAQVLNGQ